MNRNFFWKLGPAGMFWLATVSATIGLQTPASAATPQQCATLKALLNAMIAIERTAQDESFALSKQLPVLATALLYLEVKYKEIDKADFRNIQQVGTQLSTSAAALTKDFDAQVKVLNDSVSVVGDLCR
jgi:hypothetical protein